MTMHLARGLSTTRTANPKQHNKLTTAQHNKLIEEHRAYNKRMQQAGRHSERMTFEQYVDYVYGKKTNYKKPQYLAPAEVKTYQPKPTGYRRETGNYKSADIGWSIPAKPEKKEYTGTLVKGIATMHKSNAVPVINDEEVISISQMRRN